ncbi:hypothetical protein BYT27DRAFT_7098304 [Phlegmacium glaucopus]|nr:hypothetical protein BYT27DRAFT_7098304 [Phlegmacium glaucopus]
MARIASPAFTGIANILSPRNIIRQEVEEDDIAAEIEAEQGTMPDLDAKDIEESKGPANLLLRWEETISSALKGVSDNTDKEYQHLINLCVTFLILKNLIKKREDFLSKSPVKDSPEFIIAWIMHK